MLNQVLSSCPVWQDLMESSDIVVNTLIFFLAESKMKMIDSTLWNVIGINLFFRIILYTATNKCDLNLYYRFNVLAYICLYFPSSPLTQKIIIFTSSCPNPLHPFNYCTLNLSCCQVCPPWRSLTLHPYMIMSEHGCGEHNNLAT